MTETNKLNILLAFAAVYLIWGSTYLAVKWAVESIPPFLTAGSRSLIAGIILLVITTRLTGLREITPVNLRAAFITGFFNFGIAHGCFAYVMRIIPSGLAAIIASTLPIWMTLLDWLWKKNSKPSRRAIIGIITGFVGMILLTGPAHITDYSGGNAFIIIIAFLAPIAWSIGSVYQKTAPLPKSFWVSASLQMIMGGIVLMILSAFSGELSPSRIGSINEKSILSFLYMIFFGSIIAYSAYVYLLSRVNISKISTYTYANAVIGVALGWTLGREVFTLRTIIAGSVIIAAIIIILAERGKENHRKKRERKIDGNISGVYNSSESR